MKYFSPDNHLGQVKIPMVFHKHTGTLIINGGILIINCGKYLSLNVDFLAIKDMGKKGKVWEKRVK